MEVVAMNGNAPFKREVHEWKHIDEKTGALLSGRAEANRYVNGNINSFGKSLLQSLETTDGTQHKQHKQMNILQAITSTGSALQVVRAQTIQTSHSSASSRRAITSTTYSHYTNGGNLPSSSCGGGDLLSISPRASHHIETAAAAHSPTTEISSRMKALLSSASSHFNAAHTSNTVIPNDSHLFQHHANNDIDQRMMKKNNLDVGMEEQSRQKQMNEMLYGNGMNKESFGLLRGKSASIEELANINDDDDDALKSYEWKRVSKIRRSLQFPTTEARRINYHHRPSRPADLPENSVNVWKIRQDIENGCRHQQLESSAMKTNSEGEFVALDSILKESTSPLDLLNSNHSDETITAESFQDIRRRLRKMSGSFIVPSREKKPASDSKISLEQNCKSLELRKNKERDITANDWLNRRKSYGFEKMHQPNESLSGTVESSIDSGLGLSRSSDLPSNWSPTNSAASETQQRTIITFGNDKSKPATTSISLFNHGGAATGDKPIPLRRTTSIANKNIDDDLKRHSIAIDEKIDEHYQRREMDKKISLVNLNGQYEEKLGPDGRQKKVEFCKTEIHFAADSGKVNIVETNTKPPPTNNFRRRRRLSGSTGLIESEYPSQRLLIEDDVDALPPKSQNVGVKVTTSIGSIYSSGSGSMKEDDTDECHSEDGLRGILKNKPIKPKPYHLGDNMESGSSLWGVKLKPVDNQHTSWRHSAELESMISKKNDDALEKEFKNLTRAIDEKSSHSEFQSTVSSNGFSTKINFSSLPQHPAAASKDTSSVFKVPTVPASHKQPSLTTFKSTTDSCQSNNGNHVDKDQPESSRGHHKISIDLKLPHPSSMDKIMDELKSTSLIIKTMKSTSYFDDAMRHLERESPFIRSSSLRLANESLPKSSSTSSMLYRNKPNSPAYRYSSSLDGDHGILNGTTEKSRDDDFEFLNGFLEENRKFQLSIAQRQLVKKEEDDEQSQQQPPVAAPRLKRIINSSQQLSQQLSQLKHLYENANDSDDEEVKSLFSKSEEEKSSELSGSWSRVRVKKIASAFQQSTAAATSENSKWQRTPLTSLYENSTSSSVKVPVVVEAAPRTSLTQIGANHKKVNSNIYSNVQQQDNSVKVNIQNFESYTPALSRSNSLRVKKEEVVTPKLSTGTRQLKAHELTYFGIKSAPGAMRTNHIETSISKASFVHLSSNNKSKTSTNQTVTPTSSKVIINHHQRPDLIMHHQQKYPPTSSTPELTSSERKSMIETLDSCIDETKNLEPLYENLKSQNASTTIKQHYDRTSDLKRDEKILFELSRAADEIMETCKEMYQYDSDEKRRKSQLLSNGTTCLETISEVAHEGRQQRRLSSELEPKSMKSKGVQVSRNFEDSLRRYHRTQPRTSSQSSIESLPRTAATKVSSASSSLITTRIKRGTIATKSSESKSSTTSIRKRENGNGSDASRRIHRVCSRERMQKSNASSSESDLPNSSVETPRRPRRTKVVKHHRGEENGKDEKKSSRMIAVESKKHSSHSTSGTKVPMESKVRSSVIKSSPSSANPNTTLSSPNVIPTSSSRKSSRR